MSILKCDNCDKTFKSKQNLDNHTKREKKCIKAEYVCKFCDNRFTTKTSMYRHMRNTCKKNNKDDDMEKDKIYEMLIKLQERTQQVENENIFLKEKMSKMTKEPKVINTTQNTINNTNCSINTGTVNNI